MTENQRLKILMKELGFNKQKDFAVALNVQQGSLSDILREKEGVGVSNSIADKLEILFNVNKNWLKTGIGEKLNPQKIHNEAKMIGEIAYPIEIGDSPFIDLGEGKYIMIVPLVNEYAYGGYLAGYKDPEFLEELPKHTIIVDKHHKGTYRAFEVVGDSMSDGTIDSIPDGSIATGRDIQQHLWTSKFHTHRFKDYIIVHKQHGIIIKRISHHDTETGIITCHSLNPDKANYADFDIHLDDVKQMFNVVNVLLKR